MTAHEQAYCEYLLVQIRTLCAENEAMSTLLDNPSFTRTDWRTTADTLASDPVFRSAVHANFAPYFDRLRRALGDANALTKLQEGAGT